MGEKICTLASNGRVWRGLSFLPLVPPATATRTSPGGLLLKKPFYARRRMRHGVEFVGCGKHLEPEATYGAHSLALWIALRVGHRCDPWL
jgi:hypothetical protein